MRKTHSLWANGLCRFCGESNRDERRLCSVLAPRLAAREALALAKAAGKIRVIVDGDDQR